MDQFLPPVEIAWSALCETAPAGSSSSTPKCDCKVRGYLEALSTIDLNGSDGEDCSTIAPGATVPWEDVELSVFVPGAWPEQALLPAAQVVLPPHRLHRRKPSKSSEGLDENLEPTRRESDESREGFNLGDCVEAAVPIKDEFPHLSSEWQIDVILQGELVDALDDNTFQFRHAHSGNTHLVTRDKLRSVSVISRTVFDWFRDGGGMLTMAKIAVPSELTEWISTPSLSGDFLCNSLWERSGILLATVHELEVNVDGTNHQEIHVYGTPESVDYAKITVSNHMKSLLDAVTFQERRSRRLKLLEDRRGRQDSSEKIEFFVHESLVGLVIGKQGENLARVARNYKVEVRVFPDENGVRRLRIYGSDPVKLDRAKAELDYHFVELPLPAQHAERFMDWIMADKNLVRDLCNRHALHSLWFHPSRHSLVICGLRRSIDDFIRTLDVTYRDAHRSPTPTLKQASLRHSSSPTTAAVSSTVGRNHSTRSQTPVLTPSLACPRPPILDALPSFQKSSHTMLPSSKPGSGASVFREFPLALTNNGSCMPTSLNDCRTSDASRDQSALETFYTGDLRSSVCSKRVSRATPPMLAEKGPISSAGNPPSGRNILPNVSSSEAAGAIKPCSWWNSTTENRVLDSSRINNVRFNRRSPHLTASRSIDDSATASWNGVPLPPQRYPSQHIVPGPRPSSGQHITQPSQGPSDSFYFCRPSAMSNAPLVYPGMTTEGMPLSPSPPQLYYGQPPLSQFEISQQMHYVRKFPTGTAPSRTNSGYAQPADVRNMQASMMAAGGYYWV